MAPESERRKWSRCRGALGLALLFDALGLAGLLTGSLLETEVSDLLIYLGGVGVFFSLPWWVFWHVGNQEVPREELRDDVGLGWRSGDAWSLESWRARRLALLARAFSAHFSLSSSAASVPSQGGRPRAHFAASSVNRPSETEKQLRDDISDTAGASFTSPPVDSSSSATVVQGLPESPRTQDRGVQVSSKSLLSRKVLKLIHRSETVESTPSQDRGKQKHSKSLIPQRVLNIITRSETIDITSSQDRGKPGSSKSLLPQNGLDTLTRSETGGSARPQDQEKPESSKTLLPQNDQN
ncbi:PREDICTED: transmembrane protein 238 [Thamnophis sirtalis]|uniref:Transmembrane protein 238 n=1 Tax=Thamnophis sirtalis TaxID=35019 RepID=A0A6I9Y0Q5_9SAUR|nr:PREDICTED: transmembrane protein 238 [Thamnophis sirtalis]